MKRTVHEVIAAVNASVGESFNEGVTSVHSERADGETALHIVAKWGDADAIAVLVEAGAKIDKVGEDCNTPLHYAAMLGNKEAAECLVHLGAKCSKDRYGNSPSQLANAHIPLQSFLLQHGF
jgi:ankyrin repeat protein